MQRPNPNQPPFQQLPLQQQQQLVQQHQQQMHQQSSTVMQQSSSTTMQQQHQQQQQFMQRQEFTQQQQQFSSSQQRISRSEQHSVSRQVTQQRVQQQHGGFIQQSTTPLASITPGVQTPTPVGVPFVQQQQQQQQPSYGVAAPTPTGPGDYSPPVFEQIFKNSRFAQGGNALFEGKLKGNPRPEVSWTREGAPLLDSAKHRLSYNPSTGAVSLLINQIGPGDEGE